MFGNPRTKENTDFHRNYALRHSKWCVVLNACDHTYASNWENQASNIDCRVKRFHFEWNLTLRTDFTSIGISTFFRNFSKSIFELCLNLIFSIRKGFLMTKPILPRKTHRFSKSNRFDSKEQIEVLGMRRSMRENLLLTLFGGTRTK